MKTNLQTLHNRYYVLYYVQNEDDIPECVYSYKFYAINHRNALFAVFDIGEEIYDLADIEFDSLILYFENPNRNYILEEITSLVFNPKDIF